MLCKVEAIKDQLLANNGQTYWVPSFVKEKRFHNWLRDARDWAISRNRFTSPHSPSEWMVSMFVLISQVLGHAAADLGV